MSGADDTLFELFAADAASQLDVLSSGLLELERSPAGEAPVDELMRAAHSLKGSAKIMGLGDIAKVMHAIEECFIAVGARRLSLTPQHVDLLLRAVDLISSITRRPGPELVDAEGASKKSLGDLRSELDAMAAAAVAPATTTGKQIAAQPVASVATPPVPAALEALVGSPPSPSSPSPPTPLQVSDSERVLRVSAGVVDRLLDASGELLISSRSARHLVEGMDRLRRDHIGLSSAIGQLTHGARDARTSSAVSLEDVRRRAANLEIELAAVDTQLDEFQRTVSGLAERLNDELVASRMRPFGDIAGGLERTVRDVSRALTKPARLGLRGATTAVDRDMLDALPAWLGHLVRNALDHGIEPAELRASAAKPETASIDIAAEHRMGMLIVTVSDDGRGIDVETIRRAAIEGNLAPREVAARLTAAELFEFLFIPGFSLARTVTLVSGRGVGLDAVAIGVRRMGGTIHLTTEVGRGTTIELRLPINLAVSTGLLVEIGGQRYLFPIVRVERVARVPRAAFDQAEGKLVVSLGGETLGVASGRQLLGKEGDTPHDDVSLVVLGDAAGRVALTVDSLLRRSEVVVRPLDPRLGKVRHVAAAAMLDDGTSCLVLDVEDLLVHIASASREGSLAGARPAQVGAVRAVKRILVVEDSLTVREVERRLITNLGYEVDVAVDGLEGWHAVQTNVYALVVTDVDMPRLDGIGLIERIRRHPVHSELPVLIVSYKDREEDRLRGLEAGANGYLVKASFDDEQLVESIRDLIGAPT